MNIIDLFSGCGGFSLGFMRTGFISKLAVEIDLWATETYKKNHPDAVVVNDDICAVNPLDHFSVGDIDGIIGGPPCQGFSLSGNRDSKDPRNSLFMEFVRFVKTLQPKFFVMENVTGILSMRTRDKRLVKAIIQDEFENAGYSLCITILNAAEFGVPQSRQRVFFFGVRKELPFSPPDLIPRATHGVNNQLSLWDAISDLPQINSGQGHDIQEYKVEPQNEYQVAMRTGSGKIFNHVAMRHTPRLVERFKQITYGQSVKDVTSEHGQRKRGDVASISGIVYSQNNMRPYPDRPCPTVAASFQSNFIHPYLNRNFTAREGARIQSFPDTYIFMGKRTTMSWEKHLSQYQQIGNAVPPLLAQAIGASIQKYFANIDTIVPVHVDDNGYQLAFGY